MYSGTPLGVPNWEDFDALSSLLHCSMSPQYFCAPALLGGAGPGSWPPVFRFVHGVWSLVSARFFLNGKVAENTEQGIFGKHLVARASQKIFCSSLLNVGTLSDAEKTTLIHDRMPVPTVNCCEAFCGRYGYDMTWYDMIWYDMIWHGAYEMDYIIVYDADMIRCDTRYDVKIWYDMIIYGSYYVWYETT